MGISKANPAQLPSFLLTRYGDAQAGHGISCKGGLHNRVGTHVPAARPNVLVGLAALTIALTAPVSAVGQAVLYVDADAPGPVHNGSSWCAAYTALQDGLAHAAASRGNVTEIRVAHGVYKPEQGANHTPGDRDATFELINGVGGNPRYHFPRRQIEDHRPLLRVITVFQGIKFRINGFRLAQDGNDLIRRVA